MKSNILKSKFFALAAGCALFSVAACDKVDVPFGDDGLENDPNISYYDRYQVSLSTYRIDSFLTSGHNVFAIGHHADTAFGTLDGSSFLEVNIPTGNPAENQNVSFDSLVVLLKPNGNYYGDTTQPVTLKIHRLTETIENEDETNLNFFNPRRFAFDLNPLAQKTLMVKPTRDSGISIRLPDLMGQDLLRKLKSGNDTIQDNDDFLDYLNGLYIQTDSQTTKTLFYFTTVAGGGVLRLYYKLNGAFTEEKHIDFPMNPRKQFNRMVYHHTGSNLAAFSPYKTQLKKSSVTGGMAYLHSNMASYIKISFPSLLGFKETYPYIKVMKAELVIKPDRNSYKYPYVLPKDLYLYTTDDGNALQSILVDESGQSPSTGNFTAGTLLDDKAQYSYDITSFVNNIINEGIFSKAALMLVPSTGITDNSTQRLILNEGGSNKSVELKLYVLGL